MGNWFRKKQTGELEQLREENKQLREENARLKALIVELETLVAELKARLSQNSGNSSKPPSSDPPWDPPAQKKKGSGRKPGGQPGHEDHQRELVPIEKVDEIIPIKPDRCRYCQRSPGRGLWCSGHGPLDRLSVVAGEVETAVLGSFEETL